MDENKLNELNETLNGIWDSLTDEQKEKAKACKTMDELTALAAKEGVELPDEVLDAIAGGYVYYCIYSKSEDSHDKRMAALMGNDWVEVIRDSDGKVIGKEKHWHEAWALADSLGQSRQSLSWSELDRLRKTGSIAEPKSGC